MPSAQLSRFLQLRADGVSVESAAFESGIGLKEAELTEAAIASGEVELPRARAGARAREGQSTEEGFMARDEETSLKEAIGEKLTEAGFKRKAGASNVWEGPQESLYPSVGSATIEIESPRTEAAGSVAADQLRLFIERIERLKEEVKALNDDVADVYNEAKANGFDKPTLRRIVRLRAMDGHKRQEAAALLQTYARAVGLQHALPL